MQLRSRIVDVGGIVMVKGVEPVLKCRGMNLLQESAGFISRAVRDDDSA